MMYRQKKRETLLKEVKEEIISKTGGRITEAELESIVEIFILEELVDKAYSINVQKDAEEVARLIEWGHDEDECSCFSELVGEVSFDKCCIPDFELEKVIAVSFVDDDSDERIVVIYLP